MNVVQCDAVGVDGMILFTRFTLELSIPVVGCFSSHYNGNSTPECSPHLFVC